MPWEVKDVMDRRIEFVIRASQKGANKAELCREYKISRKTGYKWIERYQSTNSVLNLVELSRRPHTSPNRTSKDMESLILKLHHQHFGLSGKKIQNILHKTGYSIAPITVHRVLQRNGLVKERIGSKPATKRFEMEKPNDMWQMDLKGPFKKGAHTCIPLSLLDDHSRYITGLHALFRTTAPEVHKSLVKSFRAHGVPKAILTDHGTPWWSNSNGHGLTWLSIDLIKQGIKLRFCGFRHPQTQGKVERFHKTLKAGISFHGEPNRRKDWQPLLNQFCHTYNQIRAHESLGNARPGDVYHQSTKEYNPSPPPWEYPEAAKVKRLNIQGCLYWKSRYYFVCEALASEWVQIEEIEDNLLVKYRNVYIREINTSSCRTIAIVRQEGNIIV